MRFYAHCALLPGTFGCQSMNGPVGPKTSLIEVAKPCFVLAGAARSGCLVAVLE